MKLLPIILVASIFLSGCASREIRNDPDTIVDDIIILGTFGLYRGGL